MMTTILYDVVNSTDFSGFLAMVRIKLKEGWKLQGGVSAIYIESGSLPNLNCVEYLQAIIKEVVEYEYK